MEKEKITHPEVENKTDNMLYRLSFYKMKDDCQTCNIPRERHHICNACGCPIGPEHNDRDPIMFRNKSLCSICYEIWLDRDARLGRPATWYEMMTGIQLIK